MPLTGFHPTVVAWFTSQLGEPTAPQRDGWPHIRAGRHTLIAAPTGSGKTLAAFLSAIDGLLREGPDLPDETRVLYVSPLKALSNDVQKNLQEPLRQIRELNIFLPDVRVLVRTGDTPASQRSAMGRKPPHILVTTPESLYILLTSASGRNMLRTVRTVIVDEIHALARDKRGAHLALSLERLEALVRSPRSETAGVPQTSRSASATADSPREACPSEARACAPPSMAALTLGHATPAASAVGGSRSETAPTVQRIGLSATQKPIEDVARFLVGVGRECATVDVGHRRQLDLAIETPRSPLSPVCAHEVWEEIYERMADLIGQHRTTLVFVNTRKLAERIAARLTTILGEDQVTCHHGSMSRPRRLSAEQRLKNGQLKALVATASLELGIDIGDVDLAIQIGSSRSIATFLQRVGRAGHSLSRIPKGRLFPLTIDELVEAAAVLRAVGRGELDRTPHPRAPLDILAQQIVAACVPEPWGEQELFETFQRSWPYRELTRGDFDAVVGLHTEGRRGLLHRDGVGHRLLARKRARITAVTCGGAIPDVADYQVLMEPAGTQVGTLNEDFAIESNVGDIFQLGNTSWRILKIEPGIVRVADAKGQPPTLPFWLGEAPGRTPELSAAIGEIRETSRDVASLAPETGANASAAQQIVDYFEAGRRALGTVPTHRRVVLERFFDESGGQQLVLHALFGGRINRAWGLALRKRFCRGFGFELQAAANEESIVLSLGTQHSFALADVFDFLQAATARDVLIQALLATPMFEARWRWNATRSLLIERFEGGKRVRAPLIRMRANDLLATAFPQAVACPENLPGGDLPVPMEHPLVRQTIEDCLHEAMDIDGFLDVLRDLHDGRIERVAIDTPEPSAFAGGILNALPYSFLDDAPLEERRTQAVIARRGLDTRTADELGALSPEAVARVCEEAWPHPDSAEEVHEALLWMGYVTEQEAEPWRVWIDELAAAGRVMRDADRWFAAESARDPKLVLRGRLEALGPVFAEADALIPASPAAQIGNRKHLAPGSGDKGGSEIGNLKSEIDNLPFHLAELEHEGVVMRTRVAGREAWCERRLLARIHRYTLDRLRSEIEPVSAAEFLRFLACWQHVDAEYRLEGPRGVAEVVRQLAGFEIPAARWESSVLPSRVRDFRREWLDELSLLGEVAWGRLWGSGASPVRTTPTCLLPRDDLETWLSLAKPPAASDLFAPAAEVLDALRARGAMFLQEIQRVTNLLPAHLEMGLAELIARGLITCDSFAGLRQLIAPRSRRRTRARPIGRWSLFRTTVPQVSRSATDVPQISRYARDVPRVSRPARAVPQISRSASDTGPEFPRPASLERTDQTTAPPDAAEFIARQLLSRTGVVFRRTLLREKQPLPWYELLRIYRRLEMRGEVRGGRFVAGFSGEQYALPEAVELLRKIRRIAPRPVLTVLAADPLNFQGILTPAARVASASRARVAVG